MAAGEREPLAGVHLLLFSRAPVPGRTKTRLTPPLTPEQACALHVACLNDLIAAGRDWRTERTERTARTAADSPPVSLHLFVTPPASQPAFRRAGVRWPNDYALHNQRGETLGERMEHAIRRVRRGAPAPAGVLLVGTDLPLLGPAQWDAATEALAEADVVFGPTLDGGYYLVGTRCDPAGLFALEGWGGTGVLERSLSAARAAGRSVATIEALPDADEAADLRTVLAHPRAEALAGRSALRLIRELPEV